ncbi:cysteine--tRNA ligase [Prolixibacter sp. NT017]|uniref:cysteine--tRNA ligase n=1 Tax=Prolixibacter sp. NT017 TaxID=2652390 RepID=UPI00128011B7|nr:cysteine--tRNA ligase [Prolixibacter sp. NT017]GET27370.1 cysteine--tRNA ligase [Prolixibacter sp. NT017]
MDKLVIYNTLTRKKELFKPIHPGAVGMYVCGPTVYGEAHLGHARPAITFDMLFRYLKHVGYKVRYVRNITDVGHLVDDADEGEDKIERKAKVEQLEPMEVVQMYTNSYRGNMARLNNLPPSIEPTASGHIIEQVEAVKKILEAGYGYESNGSVYFDVERFSKDHHYGKLSGRKVEDLYSNTRELDGQSEKRSSMDFALWKKATPEHIMRWPSPWSDGYPGWHMECTAMSTKYLGERFDIHGGGMDLLFPHHEAEIAQSVACTGHESVNYWMHNNLITINGQKMGKSLGNFITLNELFGGKHDLLEKAYSPMTIRFFILQAHYRSPLDFSNEALQAAEKGMERLMKAIEVLGNLPASAGSTVDVAALKEKCYEAMNDDLNSPVLIAHLFDGVKMINSINDGKEKISAKDLTVLQQLYREFAFDILGLQSEEQAAAGGGEETMTHVVDLLLNLRIEAKKNKDWATADKIRNELSALGFEIKDTKDGFSWELKK